MPAPSFMYEHALNPLKGWFQPYALDFAAKLSPAVTFDVPGGRVVHLNAAGEFEPGVSGTDMPIFLFSASDAQDVSNPGTTASGRFMHQAIAPTGVMVGLVATGGYELETTEFDTAPTAEYAPGQLLTALPHNTDASIGGVLCNDRGGPGQAAGPVRQYVDAACGVVSRGRYLNEHGVDALAFWPVYLPAQFA